MSRRKGRRHDSWEDDDDDDEIVNPNNQGFFQPHQHQPIIDNASVNQGVSTRRPHSSELPPLTISRPHFSPQESPVFSRSQRPPLGASVSYNYDETHRKKDGVRFGISVSHRPTVDDQMGRPYSKSFTGGDKSYLNTQLKRKVYEKEPKSNSPVSPFGGINPRWHSGIGYSSSEAGSNAGSTKRAKKSKKKKKVKQMLSDQSNASSVGPFGYGDGWTANPAPLKYDHDHNESHHHPPGKSPENDPTRDFLFGVDDPTTPHTESPTSPGQKGLNQSTRNTRHVDPHHRHTSPHHLHHPYTPSVSDYHEMASLGRNNHYHPHNHHNNTISSSLNTPQGSVNGSHYNFNNRASPKTESQPKNFEDLVSIKNQLDKYNKTFDKTEHWDIENKNRFPGKNSVKNKSQKGHDNSVGIHSGTKGWSKSELSPHDSIHNVKLSNYNRAYSGSDLDSANQDERSRQLREDFQERQRKKKRRHVIFLLLLMLVVAIAVVSTVLASTLGATEGEIPKEEKQIYSIVVSNMTLKILNRKFEPDLLVFGSEAFKNLAQNYSVELSDLFLKSNLSGVYSKNEILYFRNGSIYATSSITFLDAGLIKSSKDVENVITSADTASDWKDGAALKLGQFVVCKNCTEAKVEFVKSTAKPDVMLHSIEPPAETVQENLVDPNWQNSVLTPSTPSVALKPSPKTPVVSATTDLPPVPVSPPSEATTIEVRVTPSATSTPHTTGDDVTERDENVTNGPTVIRVSNISVLSSDNFVTVGCYITNPNDWSSIDVWHKSLSSTDSSRDKLIRLDRDDLYVKDPLNIVYAERVKITYEVSEYHILIDINIANLSCHDDGYIECSLVGKDTSLTSAQGRLEVTALPSVPRLTIPVEVIEGRPITQPILCEADVGYPPWTLQLTAQLPDTSEPVLLPSQEENDVNGCKVIAIRKVKSYLPNQSIDGTTLRCVLQKTAGNNDEVKVDEGTLHVIKGDICEGKPDRTELRHQFLCSHHILCADQQPTVKACPTDQCYDIISGKCGVKSVMAEVKNGILNEGLAGVTCSVIHFTDWSEIIIRRLTSSGQYYDLVSVDAAGNVSWHDPSLGMRAVADFRSSTLEVVLEMWIYVLKCGDEGLVQCYVKGMNEEKGVTAELKVFAAPEAPTLKVPDTAIAYSSDPVTVTCEANLGRPRATLALKLKLQDETEAKTITSATITEQQVGECMTIEKIQYNVTTSPSQNGTTFVCEITPSSDLPALRKSYRAEETYFILPADTCNAVKPTLLPHPRDCRLFIQCAQSKTSVLSCGPGLCFNMTSQQCDILSPASRMDTQNDPCFPDKHGTYLPHPSLCNKHIRCDMGRQLVEHCQRGQLYFQDGLCTSNIKKSYCFGKLVT